MFEHTLHKRRSSCYLGAMFRIHLGTPYLRFGTLAMLLAGLLLASMSARAMVVVKREFPELVARAEQIVVGTVTEIHEQLDASGAPSTLVTFTDLTVLKGDAGATLTLSFYGGHAGDVVVRIPDMPTFTVGERDVLFVAGNGSTVCPLVGVWQGRFYVRFDPAVGADIVEDSAHHPVTGLVGGELVRAPAVAGGQAPMTLEGFRQLIANELAHPHSNDAR